MRYYGYTCDKCGAEITLESNSNKPPGWAELLIKIRPVDETGQHDAIHNLIFCGKCTSHIAEPSEPKRNASRHLPD
jgi:hypothetical protein